jgi:hypothetical protein
MAKTDRDHGGGPEGQGGAPNGMAEAASWRAGKAELLTGIEGASRLPVRKIVLTAEPAGGRLGNF